MSTPATPVTAVAIFTITIIEYGLPKFYDDGSVDRARVTVHAGETMRDTHACETLVEARRYADGVFVGLRIAQGDATIVLNEVSRDVISHRW